MDGGDDMGAKYLLYNMTKAAVLHGTKMEAADPALTSRHITVAAICPGWCRVRVLAVGLRSASRSERLLPRIVAVSDRIKSQPKSPWLMPCSRDSRPPHEPAPARAHACFECHLCHARTAGCMMQPGCSSTTGYMLL